METKFSGVVSMFREAETVYSRAFGFRDVKNELPNTTGTAFGIASGTKLFTALGIGVLIDRGRLSLDTAVGDIDDKYTGFIDEKATIRQLLTHSSGFFAFNDLPGNTANGYLEDRRTTNIYQLPLRGGGDGGMYTTTDDLRAFWTGLFSHRILPKELTETFLATHSRFNDEAGYGCGIYKQLDDSMFSIVGGDAGVGFDSRYLLREELTVNILCNVTNGENDMRNIIMDHLR